MPQRPSRPCVHKGCRELHRNASSYCDRHQAEVKAWARPSKSAEVRMAGRALQARRLKHWTAERIQAQFADLGDLSDADALDRLDKLSRLRDRESKAVSTLSAKLRLTQQSRYTAGSAATAARRGGGGAKPWEFDDDDPHGFFKPIGARQ